MLRSHRARLIWPEAVGSEKKLKSASGRAEEIFEGKGGSLLSLSKRLPLNMDERPSNEMYNVPINIMYIT
jgi:hypothetical protein